MSEEAVKCYVWFPKISYMMTSWWVMIYSSSEAANWSIELIVSAVDAELAVRNADFCFFGSDSSSSDILRFLKFLILKNHFVIWQLFWGVILKPLWQIILLSYFEMVILKGHLESWRSWGTPTLKVFHLDFPTICNFSISFEMTNFQSPEIYESRKSEIKNFIFLSYGNFPRMVPLSWTIDQ